MCVLLSNKIHFVKQRKQTDPSERTGENLSLMMTHENLSRKLKGKNSRYERVFREIRTKGTALTISKRHICINIKLLMVQNG